MTHAASSQDHTEICKFSMCSENAPATSSNRQIIENMAVAEPNGDIRILTGSSEIAVYSES